VRRVLERVTTEFVAAEDRLRLAGVSAEGRVVLWLTRRLLERLLPALFAWLEGTGPAADGAAGAMGAAPALWEFQQQWAQSAALAALQAGPPVPADAADAVGLVTTVSVASSAAALSLTFMDEAQGLEAVLPMSAANLRQWLQVVWRQYVRAEWPLELWPAWLREEPGGSAGTRPAYLH